MDKIKLSEKLFGNATTAKASGLAFSFSALLPTAFSIVFLIAIAMLGLTSSPEYTSSDWFLYANYLIPQLSFAVIALWFFRYRKIDSLEIKRQVCAPKYFILAVLLQVGLFSLSELNSLFLTFLERFGYQDKGIQLPSMQGWGLVGVLLAIAVMPAVFEELFFRGVLFEGVKSFGPWKSVLICGALFSLYHQNPAQTLYQFCCGAAFALMALRSGSVLPTVLAHFINNALIIVLTKFGVNSFPTPVFIAILCVSVLCLVFSLWFLIFKDRTEVDKREKADKSFFVYAAVGIAVCAITWLSVLLSGM